MKMMTENEAVPDEGDIDTVPVHEFELLISVPVLSTLLLQAGEGGFHVAPDRQQAFHRSVHRPGSTTGLHSGRMVCCG